MKKRYFEIAEEIAEKSRDKFKVGAVLVRGHNIIGVGCNSMSKTHTIMNLVAEESRKDFIGVHAEFEACRGLRPYDVGNRAKLYVFRKLRSGGQGLAKPCAACMKLIDHLGIRRVYYSLNNKGFSTMRV